MDNNVELSVKNFYDEKGWSGGEDELFRQFSTAYRSYHQESVLRTIKCFKSSAEHLLIVGGGDIPGSHQRIAEKFSKVTCIDISSAALTITERKLPNAERVCGSICDAPFEDRKFDAIFAAHVLYHIDREQQERAVREMIRVLKPGGRIVILYSNPQSPIRYAAGIVHRLKKMAAPEAAVAASGLYFSPHKLKWWDQFEDECTLTKQPWDIIGSYEERTLVPFNWMASTLYRAARGVEAFAPNLAVAVWQYPIITLDKKSQGL